MNTSMSDEVWKDIPGFDGVYQASTRGRIKSIDRVNGRGFKVRGKILRPNLTGIGYQAVALWKDCKPRTYCVHRLVAETFLGGHAETVNHKDGNKLNNHVDNLEWATWSENTLHAYRNDLNTHSRRVEICFPDGRREIVNSLKHTGPRFGYSSSWVHDRVKRDGNPFYHDGHKITVIS